MFKHLILLIAALTLSHRAIADNLPGFDFAYEIGGRGGIAPLQIFDDGLYTYVQWPVDAMPNDVKVIVDGKPHSAIGNSTPFFKVKAVGSILEFRAGQQVAKATYVGERGNAPMQIAQTEKPRFDKARATLKANERANALSFWEVLDTDRTVENTLRRWTRLSGHTLYWQIADTIQIDRGATYRGNLPQALAQLAKHAGIAIRIDELSIFVTEVQAP